MNIEINLMPWREIRLKEEKQKNINLLLMGFSLILIICFLINYFIVKLTNEHENFNHKIKNEIVVFNEKIKEIESTKVKEYKLLRYICLLQKLENKKILLMHFFSDLSQLVPDEIYLSRVKGVQDQIILEGFSESNKAISQLIKKIEGNPWMKNPNLIEIKRGTSIDSYSSFKVNFILSAKI